MKFISSGREQGVILSRHDAQFLLGYRYGRRIRSVSGTNASEENFRVDTPKDAENIGNTVLTPMFQSLVSHQ